MKKISLKIQRGAKSGTLVRVDSGASGPGTYAVVIESGKRPKRQEAVVVRSLSRSEKETIEHANQQLRQIVSSPISVAQRLKAQELADKSKLAQDSEVTAKFRRHHAN